MEGNQMTNRLLAETDTGKTRLENAMQNILKQLNSNKERKRFLTVLEKMLELQDDKSNEKELRLQVVYLLSNHLETSDSEQFKALSEKLERIFSCQEYKKYIVDSASIENGSIELGSGDYGSISLGKLRKSDGSWLQVAVKRATNDRNNKTCLAEAKLMTQFDHENVIKILALQKTPPRIAMEYMDWGDLKTALLNRNLTDMDLLNAFHNIASGMEYIAAKNYVHRDLWLKNVFINSKKQCKVGDFEHCVYMGGTNGFLDGQNLLPVMYFAAPEAMGGNIFSTKSDVWSVGFLIWEAYIVAERKSGITFNLQDMGVLLQLLLQGAETLPKPLRCPSMVHRYVCQNLLNNNPGKRHTFTLMKETMSQFLSLTTSACLNDLN